MFIACFCVRPVEPCTVVCMTVERWASACRSAHWYEDDTLEPWSTFSTRIDRDSSEPDLWREVAIAALIRLSSDE